jgi:hypothetical protein
MRSLIFIASFLVLIACDRADPPTLFTLLPPSATGLDFSNELEETEAFNIIEYLYFNNGGGVAAGDINNDGLTDLYFTSNQNNNKLFLNKGDLRFEDITESAGVSGNGDWSTGVSMADVNGDGLLDIYVCQVSGYKGLKGHNLLFMNQGDLSFKEVADNYQIDFQGFSTQSVFFDHDLDGDLDMYLLNHSVHTSASYGASDLRLGTHELAGDRLFRNESSEGNSTFTDITSESGIYSSQIGYGLGVNVSDLDNDGYPDIYISNDFHENDYLYINNRDGTYTDRLTQMLSHTSRSSMGNDVADINNDGRLDIFVLDMLPDDQKIRGQSGGEDDLELFRIKLKYGYYHQYVRNTLQLNLGEGLFSEIGRLAEVYSTDWSWSPLICDLDNDGWKDLFITSGIYRRANDLDYIQYLTGGNRNFPSRDNSDIPNSELYKRMPLQPDVNHLFKNNRDLRFTEMSGVWSSEVSDFSNGSAYADLDNDGDLDLVVNNINSPASLYRNNSETQLNHHYLSVKLNGKGLNTMGTGARITLSAKGQLQICEQSATRGFLSSSSPILHFGLGSVGEVDSLTVRWPDQSYQTLYDLSSNQLLTLDQSLATPPENQFIHKKEIPPLFQSVKTPGLEFTHREDPFNDLDRERLIPHSLAHEGPALAVGDVNNDGLDDLFVGGARGQSGQLYIQKKGGSFSQLQNPILRGDRISEDVDAAFFDADGDGDQDLYVVHGGNEELVGNPFLMDRLLINEGNGVFVKSSPKALPYLAHNGSCVSPADFDLDGDIDLFIGSRSVPGAYGLTPTSLLLENKGGGFFEATDKLQSGELQTIGMVTDASWGDVDGDGDPDLMVVGEWMQVSLFRNDRTSFTNRTLQAGLENTSGWWNCIRVVDMDGDGDLDLLAGNYGLNSMLKPTLEEPVEMYVNDFDNNGRPDQILCSYKNGISYPLASLDELMAQIPGLKESFPSYSDFGGQTVSSLFDQEILQHSIKKVAFLFETSLFVNNGTGFFDRVKLPREAQLSSVRDILSGDFNQDGLPDLILCGNNYQVRPSLGRQDASHGLYLRGIGENKFLTQAIAESGLFLKGDSRNIRALKSNERQHFVAAINDGELQMIKLRKEGKQ